MADGDPESSDFRVNMIKRFHGIIGTGRSEKGIMEVPRGFLFHNKH